MCSNVAALTAGSPGKGKEVLQHMWIEKSCFSFCWVLKYHNAYFIIFLFLKVSPRVPQQICKLDENFGEFTVNLSTDTDNLFQLCLTNSVTVL